MSQRQAKCSMSQYKITIHKEGMNMSAGQKLFNLTH